MSDDPRDDVEVAEVVRRELLLLHRDAGSAEDLAALLHPAFVEFGASGRVWDAPSVAGLLVPGQPAGAAQHIRALRLAQDVVLVTYTALTETGRSLRSSVWVRQGEHGWLVRFHQGTPERQQAIDQAGDLWRA